MPLGMSFLAAVDTLCKETGFEVGKENQNIPTRKHKEQYSEDKIFIAIYESDIKKGINPSWNDKKRMKLARMRINGLKERYGSKIEF